MRFREFIATNIMSYGIRFTWGDLRRWRCSLWRGVSCRCWI